MLTSVSRRPLAPYGPIATDRHAVLSPWVMSPLQEKRGKDHLRHTVPGFRAYPLALGDELFRVGLPGFGADRYRDLRHTADRDGTRRATGIPGTPLPGVGAHDHREPRHGRTGIRGIQCVVATGNPGTTSRSNLSGPLPISARNSVFGNPSRNTTTGGGLFSGGGGR